MDLLLRLLLILKPINGEYCEQSKGYIIALNNVDSKKVYTLARYRTFIGYFNNYNDAVKAAKDHVIDKNKTK